MRLVDPVVPFPHPLALPSSQACQTFLLRELSLRGANCKVRFRRKDIIRSDGSFLRGKGGWISVEDSWRGWIGCDALGVEKVSLKI